MDPALELVTQPCAGELRLRAGARGQPALPAGAEVVVPQPPIRSGAVVTPHDGVAGDRRTTERTVGRGEGDVDARLEVENADVEKALGAGLVGGNVLGRMLCVGEPGAGELRPVLGGCAGGEPAFVTEPVSGRRGRAAESHDGGDNTTGHEPPTSPTQHSVHDIPSAVARRKPRGVQG